MLNSTGYISLKSNILSNFRNCHSESDARAYVFSPLECYKTVSRAPSQDGKYAFGDELFMQSKCLNTSSCLVLVPKSRC